MGPWKADAERVLSRDFDPWDVAEAIVDFAESTFKNKGYRATLNNVSLEAAEGDPRMKSVKDARVRAAADRLTPMTLWFFVDGHQADPVAWRPRAGIQVRVDFPDTLRHFEGTTIHVTGVDRDEVTGLGQRFQKWLDELTPTTVPVAAAPVATAPQNKKWSRTKKAWVSIVSVVGFLAALATIVGVIDQVTK